MRNNFKFISLALSAILCFAAMAFGQATSGSIEGVLKDPQGALLPGATVTARSVGSTAGFNRSVTTDQNGYFNIPNVPVGNYEITIEKSGFATQKVQGTVTLDRAFRVDTALAVGSANVDVTVNAENITIDPTESKLQTNITQQLFNALPKGTTFTSVLKAAPNVRPEALSGGFQIDGASGSENVWVIDGQEVTNFRTGVLDANNNLPFELIQEVQVKSTGFEAEYGGATGGVITVVTQGGNNTFHGNFGMSFRPQKIQGGEHAVLNRYGSAAGAYEYFNVKKVGGIATFPVAKLNGPIIKDKLWFSAVYAPQIFDYNQDVPFFVNASGPRDPLGRYLPTSNPNTRSLSETQNFASKQVTQEAFIRLDAQPNEKIRAFASYLWNPISFEGSRYGYTAGLSNFSTVNPYGPLLPANQLLRDFGGRQNSNSVNGQVTWTPTSKLVINAHAGRSFLNEKSTGYGRPNVTRYTCSTSSRFLEPGNSTPDAPAGSVTYAQAGCNLGFASFPDNYQVAYDVSTRTLFDADASLVGINALGRHNFKFGYQYNRIFNTTDQGYRNTGVVVLAYGRECANVYGYSVSEPDAIGCGYIQRFATQGEASSASNALFVQDSWQIGNRLTLNLGVRADSETVPSFNAANPGIKFGWGDKIAPRLGFAFDVFGNGKTKVFGSYGWFYDRFKYELPRGSFGGDFYRRDFFDITPTRGISYTNYTYRNILGANPPDPQGGICPGTSIAGGWSVCNVDYRVPSNLVGGSIYESGAVDPDLKAARQSEYTFGVEHQLMRNWIITGRYTHKQVDHAIEDTGVLTPSLSEAYIIANPGEGLACKVYTEGGYDCVKPQRDYDAAEFRIDKRLSNHWFFNASYTWSRLYGNYAGLANSDEAGRTSPNVSRNFDLPLFTYTLAGNVFYGLLPTDRTHVFKAYGGYDFEWSKSNTTTISAFTVAESGTPLSTTVNFVSSSWPIYAYERGNLGRSAPVYTTDLNIDHKYKFGRDDRFVFQPYVNINNLFNRQSYISVDTLLSDTTAGYGNLLAGGCPQSVCNTSDEDTGYEPATQWLFQGNLVQYFDTWRNANPTVRTRNTYGQETGWTAPREIRFGFRLYF